VIPLRRFDQSSYPYISRVSKGSKECLELLQLAVSLLPAECVQGLIYSMPLRTLSVLQFKLYASAGIFGWAKFAIEYGGL
jgi:hypothetical protein